MSLNKIIDNGLTSEKWKNLRCNNLTVDDNLTVNGNSSFESISLSSGVQSVVATLGGFNTNPATTATLQYQVIGDTVNVSIPTILINQLDQSNNLPLDILGLPSSIRPAQDTYKIVTVINGNGTVSPGTVRINASNAEIQIWQTLGNQAGITSGATSAGNMHGFNLSYLI